MGEEVARRLSDRTAAVEVAGGVFAGGAKVTRKGVGGEGRWARSNVHARLGAANVRREGVKEEAKVEIPSKGGGQRGYKRGVGQKVGHSGSGGGGNKARDFTP